MEERERSTSVDWVTTSVRGSRWVAGIDVWLMKTQQPKRRDSSDEDDGPNIDCVNCYHDIVTTLWSSDQFVVWKKDAWNVIYLQP